ncbi:hypothetical protein AK812_SmicGene39336 [Symbiodinium microadriaticum]|uniref:Uncharacterized protein n=1 Tax=Symbiodinium microadriaticum TaxID=2951 RepID=A0A1Q9CBR8_SYMMI|nr:hypothetical protein AK812_SmicGene39336 [Symbiodinium microadriaticum]
MMKKSGPRALGCLEPTVVKQTKMSTHSWPALTRQKTLRLGMSWTAARQVLRFGSMTAGQLDALRKLGTRLLQEAEECMPWSSASHCGFRPMRAAGFPRTIAIWHSDNATLSWRRNTLHESSFMMPRQGLVEKVLQDRVEEMVASFWNVVAFRRRFTCIPIVPASGGCARSSYREPPITW